MRNKTIRFLTIVLLLIGFYQCNETQTTQPEEIPGTVTGVVLDLRDSSAVESVTVRQVGTANSCVTDSAGQFVLSDVSREEVILYFQKDNFLSSTHSADLSDSDSVDIGIFFLSKDYGVITGRIFNSDSQSVSQVSMILQVGETDSLIDSCSTDSSGLFGLTYHMPDTNEAYIIISKDGFEIDTVTRQIGMNDSVYIAHYLLSYLTLTGGVYDSLSQSPLYGANVLVNGEELQSDSSGAYTVSSLLSVDTGYSFLITKEYYASVSFRDTFLLGDSTIPPVYLRQNIGAVQGTVLLENESDHSGIIITLSLSGLSGKLKNEVGEKISEPELIDTTDATGVYFIDNVEEGQYEFRAEKDSTFETVYKWIAIVAGDTARCDTILFSQ